MKHLQALWDDKVLQIEKDRLTTGVDELNKISLLDSCVQNVLLPIEDGVHLIVKKNVNWNRAMSPTTRTVTLLFFVVTVKKCFFYDNNIRSSGQFFKIFNLSLIYRKSSIYMGCTHFRLVNIEHAHSANRQSPNGVGFNLGDRSLGNNFISIFSPSYTITDSYNERECWMLVDWRWKRKKFCSGYLLYFVFTD